MSERSIYIEKLNKVDVYASSTKFERFRIAPLKYILAIVCSKIVARFSNFSFKLTTKTFFGERFVILLPSAIDIYLSGGKTHCSEIRLAKYLILHLKSTSVFLDIGAHFGYFTLLASRIANEGKSISIEPSSAAFEILKENTSCFSNIIIRNIALSSENSSTEFYEFPPLYSEFNTLSSDQYLREEWYNNKNVKTSLVSCMSGDSFISEINIKPDVIKIDVEGAEDKVIFGLQEFLTKNSPSIIMEFSHSERGNTNHILADTELRKLGYKAYKIEDDGSLIILDIPTHNFVDSLKLESDNIVYKK